MKSHPARTKTLARLMWVVTTALLLASMAWAAPIGVYPPNPHYFVYHGKPILLITSDQHYGAVVNSEFDYVRFLDKLHSKGLNFTRIYPGTLLEKENDYLPGNNLGPRAGKQVLPWARTTITGASPVLGGYKFDLDRWDPAYFDRLKDFCAKAQDRDVIVEICLFNGMYANRWDFQAMQQANNIQGVGTCTFDLVQSLVGDARLLSYQEKYVAEIARRLNDFDNVIFHIADEPWKGKESTFGPWMDRLATVFKDTEAALPKKHLLGQTVDLFMRDNNADMSADGRIQYIDIEYVRGAIDLKNEYGHDKPIVFIESSYYPVQYKGGDKIGASRVEAWEFMVGGCAGFMQLNGLYSTSNADAKGTEIDQVLDIFVKLRSFMQSFNWSAMKRDDSFIADGVPPGAFASASSEPGKQYAFYIHHSVYVDPPGTSKSWGHSYVVTPGAYGDKFTFTFPAGTYRAEWINPSTGVVVRAETVTHAGGTRKLTAPGYNVDIALRMKATGKSKWR